MTQQDLDAIRAIIQQETLAIVQRETRAIIQQELAPIREQLNEVQEDTQITRGAVNALCEWAEHVAVVTSVTFPVKKAE